MSEIQIAARRNLKLFLLLTFGASAIIEGFLIATHDPIESHMWLTLLLMWSPGIASILCRLRMRQGFRDVSFRWNRSRGTRATLIAWLFPLPVGMLAY